MRIYKFEVNVKNYEGFIRPEHISFTDMGKYLGNFKNINAWCNSILQFKEPTLDEIKGCSLYRYPKLLLSRDKVDSFKNLMNISITRNTEKADYKIVSKNYLKSLVNQSSVVVTASFFKENIKEFKNCFNKDASDKIEKECNKIFEEHGEGVRFIFKQKSTWNNSQFLMNLVNLVHSNRENSSCVFVPVKFIETFNEVIKSDNLISDIYINKLCDSQSNILDANDVETIVSLLETQDIENHEVALNLIANCNIDESYDKVAFVFYFYNANLRVCPSWNSINVKQMRRVMKDFNNFNDYFSGVYYTRFVYLLGTKNKNTKWSKQMSAKMLIEKGFAHFGVSNAAFKINPEDIEVSEPDNLYVL